MGAENSTGKKLPVTNSFNAKKNYPPSNKIKEFQRKGSPKMTKQRKKNTCKRGEYLGGKRITIKNWNAGREQMREREGQGKIGGPRGFQNLQRKNWTSITGERKGVWIF